MIPMIHTFNGVGVDSWVPRLHKMLVVVHLVPGVAIVRQRLVGFPSVGYDLNGKFLIIKKHFIDFRF